MIAIGTALVLLYLVMAIAPGTPAARAVRSLLVDRPAAWANGWTRDQLLVTVVFVGGTLLAAATLGHEAARGIAMVLPELATWMTMFEITAYLDALVGVVTALTAASRSGLRAWLGAVLPRRAARARTRRQRRTPAARKPANDDDPVALPLAA